MIITTDQIVAAIRDGADTFGSLCEQLSVSHERQLDRAMQKARKEGAIRYDRKTGTWVAPLATDGGSNG